jgi:hypothetical protein
MKKSFCILWITLVAISSTFLWSANSCQELYDELNDCMAQDPDGSQPCRESDIREILFDLATHGYIVFGPNGVALL